MQNYKEDNKQTQQQQKKQNFAPRLLVHQGNDLGVGQSNNQETIQQQQQQSQDENQGNQQNKNQQEESGIENSGQGQDQEFKKPVINFNYNQNGNNNNNNNNQEQNQDGNGAIQSGNAEGITKSLSSGNFFSKINKGSYQSNPNMGSLLLQPQVSKNSNNFLNNLSSQNLLNLAQNQSSNNNTNNQYGSSVFQEPHNFNSISQKNSEQNLRQYLQQQNIPLQSSNPNFFGSNAALNYKMYQDMSYENLFKLNNTEGYNLSNNNTSNNQNMMTHAQGILGSNQSMQNLQNQQADANYLQLQNIKGNVKNTYIKKISNILTSGNSLDQLVNNGKNQNYINDEYGDSDEDQQSFENDSQIINQQQNSGENQNKQGDTNINDNENDNDNDNETFEGEGGAGNNKKQKKNRESARNSRQRKKMYIELLEKKVQELNSQISKASEFITQNWETISSILQLTPYLRYLINWRHNYIQKMKQQLQLIQTNQDHDPEQLSMIIDSFRLRLGSTGQLRKESVDYLFSHLLRSFLHTNYQYFMFGYDINQLNEDEEFNQCIKVFKDLGITDNTQLYKLIPIVRRLIQHRERFRNIVVQVYKIKKSFQKSALRVETLLDNFSMHLESEQIGKLITKIDESRKLFQTQLGKRNIQKSDNYSRESIYMSQNVNNNNSQSQLIQNQNIYGSMQGLNFMGQQQQDINQQSQLNAVNPQLFNFNFDLLNSQQQILQNFNQQILDPRQNLQQNQLKNILSSENLANQFGQNSFNFGQNQINQQHYNQQQNFPYQYQQQQQQIQQDVSQMNQNYKQQNKAQQKNKKGKKNKDNTEFDQSSQFKMEYDENEVNILDQQMKNNNKFNKNEGQILDAIKKKVFTEFEQSQQ